MANDAKQAKPKEPAKPKPAPAPAPPPERDPRQPWRR